MLNNFYYYLSISLIFFLFSCKQTDRFEDINFNYDEIDKITISSKEKKINNLYKIIHSIPYIDHSLSKPPAFFLNKWFENNVNIFGNENTFSINIIEASLKKTKVENKNNKKYQDKIIFLFEVNFLVEFILYDNSNSVMANTIVESKRSITSSRHISINDVEKITEILIFNCLKDFSKKSNELMRIHLSQFIL